MSQRGKHLLEAFQAGSSAKPSLAGAAKPSAAGGVPQFPSRGGVTLRKAQLQLLGLVTLLALLVAFMLGRASVRQVEAGDSAAATSRAGAPPEAVPTDVPTTQPAAPPAVASGNVDPSPRSAIEHALLDARNVFTIQACSYVNNESNRELARRAERYLSDVHGLPARIAVKGTRLFLLVGAAPTKRELEAALATVKQIAGPPPQSRATEFHDAYCEKIDNVFSRP